MYYTSLYSFKLCGFLSSDGIITNVLEDDAAYMFRTKI